MPNDLAAPKVCHNSLSQRYWNFMKVIIPLAGYGTRMRPHSWSRPKALMHVAGQTVLGHIFEKISVLTTEEVILIVGYKGDEIVSWARSEYPHLDLQVVVQEEPLGQAHALWLCSHYLDTKDVFITFGDGIIDADYQQITHTRADGLALVQEVEDPRPFGIAILGQDGRISQIVEKPDRMDDKLALVGAYWFRHGDRLLDALDELIKSQQKLKGEYYLADALGLLLTDGFNIETMNTRYWLDAGTPENILATNARLLGLGHGSEDAIERSYGEDFTVIPPVFIHKTAVIDQCVIGPYTSIGPETHLERCIVRNSIIEAGSHLADVNIKDSLVGEHVDLKGTSYKLLVGDNGQVDLG